MRVAYGFNRPDSDFQGRGCMDFFIDVPGSNRAEWKQLVELITPVTTLVVCDVKDLPDLNAPEALEFAGLLQNGVVVLETAWAEEPLSDPEQWQKGPIPDDAIEFVRPWWHSGVSLAHINRVLQRYCDCGPFNRNALNYRLKKRGAQDV